MGLLASVLQRSVPQDVQPAWTAARCWWGQSTDGPRAVTLTHIAMPQPGSGQVLVEVLAAGVNVAGVPESRGTCPAGRPAPFLTRRTTRKPALIP